MKKIRVKVRKEKAKLKMKKRHTFHACANFSSDVAPTATSHLRWVPGTARDVTNIVTHLNKNTKCIVNKIAMIPFFTN